MTGKGGAKPCGDDEESTHGGTAVSFPIKQPNITCFRLIMQLLLEISGYSPAVFIGETCLLKPSIDVLLD